MRQVIRFDPAWDHGPKGGVHGVEITFGLVGPSGAVQFKLFTNWMLPDVQARTDAAAIAQGIDEIALQALYHPMPADLGYHSPVPMYTDQSSISDCKWLDGQPCYYDGSGLNAKRVFELLLTQGDTGVWAHLRQYYDRVFYRTTAHQRAADEAFT